MKCSTLTPQQRTRVNALLDDLLELPQAERAAALECRHVDDPAVLAEVHSLLSALNASETFLTAPARLRPDDNLPDVTLGMRLGAWRLSRMIGRGGMGDVYEGMRIEGGFEQRVAIKLLQRGSAADTLRFQTERRLLAGLQHAGIARLYDGGVTDDGRLYMVMEYVDGRPITEYCTTVGATLQQRLALFDRVCAAVAYAHAHRIIHRDLKPSNILVTAAGEVKLLDFGIAKVLDTQLARMTQAGVAPLSPVCAAPEQLTGAPTTPATDVYALGLLLYELVTGSHPWMGIDTPMLQAMRIVLQRPAPLASRAPTTQNQTPVPARLLRGDLDAIIAKALRKEPGERYAQVADMQADVAGHVRGAPVGARAHARWYSLLHQLRRHRWAIAAGALALAVLVTGLRITTDRATQRAGSRTIALVGFENLSRQERDSWLGAALTEMFGTDLSNAESLSVVPDELVRDLVKGMHITGAGSFGPDTLLRLGHQLGADYVVSGNYLVTPTAGDSSLRIDIAVQEVKSGHSLTRFSQQASLAELSNLVRQIGSTVRVRLGVPAEAGAALAQLASAQPPSVDVARLMGIAYDAMQHYDASRARDALLQVITEAPGYAPAYAALSEAWFALGYRDKAVASAEQSLAHGAGLSVEMHTRIDATLQTAKYQWDKAAADWQTLIRLRPANPEYRLKFIDASIAAGNVPAAQTQLTQLRELPQAAKDPRVEIAAAHIARSLDDSKACAEHAESAIVLADAIEAPGLAADARNEFATAQTHLGSLDVAEVGFRAVIAAYQALGNPRGEADARRNLASVEADQRHIEVARAEYNRAMIIDQSIGDKAGVAAIYRHVTEMLWDGGDRDGAQLAARQALEIARDTGDLKLQAWTLRALATIASDDAASDDVMRDYQAVTALTERSGDLGGHVWSLITVADFARMRGEIQQARNLCAQGLAEAQQLTDPQFTIYATFTCGLVEMDGGAPDKAATMFRQVEVLTQKGESSMYGANTRLMLAQIDMESERCPQAIETLDRVVAEFKAAEAKSGEANAEALRAMCQQQLGNAAARDAALARAKTLRRTVTSRQEVYFVDIAVAQLAANTPRDAIARLTALSADAERRHWLGWSLEAKLAAWQLAAAHSERTVAERLKAELRKEASAHDMGRILARLQQPTPQYSQSNPWRDELTDAVLP